MKFAIDPGHGMSNASPGVYDPGAVAQVGGTTFQEADIALRYGLLLRDLLRAKGHQVFMTRDDATDAAPVGQRAHNAEKSGCDVFVSLHLNSFEAASANGVEVLYRRDGSIPLADKIRKAVVEATGLKPRPNKRRLDLAVLKFDGPAVLIELGFISNDTDRATLLNPQVREQVCEAICDVLSEGAGAALSTTVAAASLDATELASGYQLPAYARKLIGPGADALWATAKPIAGMNFYEGIVRDSCHSLPAASGLPNGAIHYEAKFAIDGDGSGGNEEGDDAYQPDTSLHDAAGDPLNSRSYPFIVLPLKHNLPGRPQWSELGVGLGDLGICVFRNGRKVAVLFGDRGPARRLGEGSMLAARTLGINDDPNYGGIDAKQVPPGICHFVFPGSRHLKPGSGQPRTLDTPATIAARAEGLLQALISSAGAGLTVSAAVPSARVATRTAVSIAGRAGVLAAAAFESLNEIGRSKVIVSLNTSPAALAGADMTSLAAHFVARDSEQEMALATVARSEVGGRRRSNRANGMRIYPHLGLALGLVDQAGLAALAADQRVRAVVPAPEISLIKPMDAREAALSPTRTWGIEAMRIPALWAGGSKGQGVIVGHLDTGIDGQHPALKTAIKAFAEFDMAGDQVINAEAKDSGWHGTHTAGTIAGRPVGKAAFGVAPEAHLVSGLVIEGGQVIDRILAGMDWVVSKNARILSLSLGLRGYTSAFEVVIEALRARNVLPIVAVGNEGPDTSRSPGNYPDTISVGAIDKALAIASFSGSQRFRRDQDALVPDIVAPGVGVLSCAPGKKYRESDGTSMATPHVAGLAALLLSAVPDATLADLEQAILGSCSIIQPVARANRGLPDAVRALGAILSGGRVITAQTAPAKKASNRRRMAGRQPAVKANGRGRHASAAT